LASVADPGKAYRWPRLAENNFRSCLSFEFLIGDIPDFEITSLPLVRFRVERE
jgi:hypothetical protein